MWKRLMTLIVTIWLSCVLTQNSFAAIGATATWEVRTTGSATNGGFYTTGGTDYSQQDAAQYALTTATTAAADAIILHASAAADMVGNGLYVVSGTNFIAGWYEIKSVVAGVSITVDRNCTSAAGALGVINVGGAVDHPNTISTVVVADNTIYIQNGTYNEVGANQYVLTTSVTSGNGTPIQWIGYITNHTTVPTGTDRPLFDATGVNNALVAGGTSNIYRNLRCANATLSGISITGISYFDNVKTSNNTTDGFDHTKSNLWFNCEISNNGDAGDDTSDIASVTLYYCYIHDNTNEGINYEYNGGTGRLALYYSIADSNGTVGFKTDSGGGILAIGCIAYNNTGATADGFVLSQANTTVGDITINNTSTNNGRYGFNRTATDDGVPFVFGYNNYNGNGTAGLNGVTAGANDNTTAPTFTAAATGDFTVTSADTALLNKGTPDANWAASVGLTAGDYQWNIGIDQSDHTATGTGGAGGFFTMGN